MFNQIWKVGENTLNVTNQYAFLDSPTKDQAQCIPDAMIQSWAAYYTHGAYANAENALMSFARSQIETGELNAISPSGFVGSADYSLRSQEVCAKAYHAYRRRATPQYAAPKPDRTARILR